MEEVDMAYSGKRCYKDEDYTFVLDNDIANAPVIASSSNIKTFTSRFPFYNQRHTQPRSSSQSYSIKAITDITKFPKKPWREPGADLSDYFNYSFDEYTWWQYSKVLRDIQNYGVCGDALYAPAQGFYEGIPLVLGLPSDRPLVDIDIDALHEKPWLIHGADPSDFFRYGDNPTTWNYRRNVMREILERGS
ncbi:hypothetical protein SUGI_1026230 [Cryptomeria japonica]|nr:hypothetical protein SUGI_1026230 [Cryptomeria japonica]